MKKLGALYRCVFLTLGLVIVFLGLALNFLDEFTVETELLSTAVRGMIALFGILFITAGLYFSQKRRADELAVSARMRKALRESEGRYRTFLKTSPSGFTAPTLTGAFSWRIPRWSKRWDTRHFMNLLRAI